MPIAISRSIPSNYMPASHQNVCKISKRSPNVRAKKMKRKRRKWRRRWGILIWVYLRACVCFYFRPNVFNDSLARVQYIRKWPNTKIKANKRIISTHHNNCKLIRNFVCQCLRFFGSLRASLRACVCVCSSVLMRVSGVRVCFLSKFLCIFIIKLCCSTTK